MIERHKKQKRKRAKGREAKGYRTFPINKLDLLNGNRWGRISWAKQCRRRQHFDEQKTEIWNKWLTWTENQANKIGFSLTNILLERICLLMAVNM